MNIEMGHSQLEREALLVAEGDQGAFEEMQELCKTLMKQAVVGNTEEPDADVEGLPRVT